MDKGDVLAVFLAGIVVGVLAIGFLFEGLDTIRIDSIEDLSPPSKTFRVVIDDVAFTCSLEPDIRSGKVVLWGCEETRGRKLVIKSFDTYSVEMIVSR